MADTKNGDDYFGPGGVLLGLAIALIVVLVSYKVHYTNAGSDYYASKILSNSNGVKIRLVRSPWDPDNEVEETITNGRLVSRTKLSHEEFIKEWEAAK